MKFLTVSSLNILATISPRAAPFPGTNFHGWNNDQEGETSAKILPQPVGADPGVGPGRQLM